MEKTINLEKASADDIKTVNKNEVLSKPIKTVDLFVSTNTNRKKEGDKAVSWSIALSSKIPSGQYTRCISGFIEEGGTPTRAILLGILRGLQSLKHTDENLFIVNVFTVSAKIIKDFKVNFNHWSKNGFKNKNDVTVSNDDILQEISLLIEKENIILKSVSSPPKELSEFSVLSDELAFITTKKEKTFDYIHEYNGQKNSLTVEVAK